MRLACLLSLSLFLTGSMARGAEVEIASLRDLVEYAKVSDNRVRLKPGIYHISEVLTDEAIAEIRAQVPRDGRPPVWMIRFSGNNNRFDLRGVVIEIDTSLYPKLPRGYMRCLFVSGSGNTIDGLTVRFTGPNQGSHGNTLSVWGRGNTLENVTLNVWGSKPYGYGDLLGKGGPNIAGLQKHSGIMISGQDHVVRRYKVISRSFGHCFYIQNMDPQPTDNIRVEDCYAEGVMRSTADMLRETSGVLADLQYRTIAENRDGRFLIVPGYMKSLSEDGFRTYGGVGRVTFINCTAVNTRAGFEVQGPWRENDGKSILEGCVALGCERAYLLGANIIVRNSRGDTRYGPLLYLRGGKGTDVELDWVGEGSDYTVHALATIAGEDHRVRLYTSERDQASPSLPVYLGFGMPEHAEMASPIRPAAASRIHLINELPRVNVIRSQDDRDSAIESAGRVFGDEDVRRLANRPAPQPTTAPATSSGK